MYDLYCCRITIAKPAPPDAPLLPPDYTSGSGPRFSDSGDLVPHSILGSVEDYKTLARKNGDLPDVSRYTMPTDSKHLYFKVSLVNITNSSTVLGIKGAELYCPMIFIHI